MKLDADAAAEYRRTRKQVSPDAVLSYRDEELLYSLAATGMDEGNSVPTIAGLMLFGFQASSRRHFPSTRVDYIRVPERDWVHNPEERYQGLELHGSQHRRSETLAQERRTLKARLRSHDQAVQGILPQGKAPHARPRRD